MPIILESQGIFDRFFTLLFFDFSLTVKAAPHERVIRTGQP